MEKRDGKFYEEIRGKKFEDKQLWWFSCKLGYGSEGTFLVEDYSFENAIEQLTNITTRLGYDDYIVFDWDINVDKKVDYDYSDKELENFKFL